MSTTLFSSSWYRVAGLRPRLRGQAKVARHVYRGERWYVLQDLASGRFMRLNAESWRVVALMDGSRTLDEIWQSACVGLGDLAPTQDEILQVLAQLHQANVLLAGRPDMDELDHRRRKLFWSKVKQYVGNPLSLKIPLVDPDRFLSWMARCFPAGLRAFLLLAWLVLVGSGLVVGALNWNELTADLNAQVFTAENLLLMALAFPLLKIIHELGHGLAIKMLGGTCHEMGLMFLVAVPVPYVDASQSTAFPSKFHRMLVGLAGMMAELAVASVAVWLWVQASPGMGKAFLHQVVVLASVTTVVFNANPLLRFDGYYVLADWLEIPNLGQKANQYVGLLINRHLFGVRQGLPTMQLTPSEPAWLLGYAVLSFCYRMLVGVGIVMLVGQRFFFVGVLLAVWAAWGTVGQPVIRQLRYLASNQALAGHRTRAWTVSALASAMVAGVVFCMPVRSWTNAEGIVWMPEASRVRATNTCFAKELLAKPGSLVKAGDPLLACIDAELDAQVAQAGARVGELQARMAQAQATDRVQSQLVESELAHAQRRLTDVQRRQNQLSIRSPLDGRFVMPSPDDFAGKFFNRGDLVGYVLEPSRFTLLAVVGQGDVDMVRNATQGVELRLADRLSQLLSARIEREVPAASSQLPSMALALQGGGKIGLMPGSTPQDPVAITSLFQFELELQNAPAPATVGQRVYVQFVHPPEPLADQWYRSVRQMFLRTFAT